MLHKDAIAGDIHSVANWIVANAAARAALTGLVTADLYKLLYQVDTATFYALTAITPTWTAVGASTGTIPLFMAYQSAAQTPTANTFQKVNLATELYDTNTNFDTTTSRFTATIAGWYHFDGKVATSVAWAANSTLAVYMNGANTINGGQSNASMYALVVSGIIHLAIGDYVELWVYPSSTAALSALQRDTYLHGFMIKAG